MNTQAPVKYSFWKGLKKTIIAAALFGAPFLLDVVPQAWLNLTIGGVAVLAVNYLKVKYQESRIGGR